MSEFQQRKDNVTIDELEKRMRKLEDLFQTSITSFVPIFEKIKSGLPDITTKDEIKKIIHGVVKETVASVEYKFSPIHRLSVGDKIVAKWPAYEGKAENPWLAATVTALDLAKRVVSVHYESGFDHKKVREDQILYCPTRPYTWGNHGSTTRGNDRVPPGARRVTLPSKIVEAAQWSCTACTYLNADIHNTCIMCNTPRPKASFISST